MTTKLWFCGGEIVTPSGLIKSDLLTDKEKILAIGSFNANDLDNVERIDCRGRILLPGLIDAHCHIALDTGSFATKDNWAIGSREAARGGITTVIDFVGPSPKQGLIEALDERLAQASESVIDYSFHMTVLDAEPKTLKSLEQVRERGLKTLKLYTTYRPNYYLSDDEMLDILICAKALDLVVLVHCENDAVVTREGKLHADEPLWRAYPKLRPEIAEVEAAERVIRLAEYAGTRLVVAHNSSAETVARVLAAKRRGAHVFCETAPQYLHLSSEDNALSQEPWRFILQPPLRNCELNAALKRALTSGDIDMMITDHCAYTRAQKLSAPAQTPGGLPGFETLLSLTAVVPGMTWGDVARVLAENPAKIYGLWPKKGALLPQFDADIVMVRDERFVIDEAKLNGFAGYSPYHGIQGRGKIEAVYRRGERLWSEEGADVVNACGQFVKV